MSETTLVTGGSISPFQAMYHELYSLREVVSNPAFGAYSAYTGSNAQFFVATTFSVTTSGLRITGGTNVTAGFIDSAQTANNRYTEFLWSGGNFSGRFLNDTYGSAIYWMQVAGGYATGVTSIRFYYGAANAEGLRIDGANGNVLAMTGALGYGTGSGGAVTQATSKSTAVTLNKANGQIVLNGAALASNTTVRFQLNNSVLVANDVVIVTLNGLIAATSSYNIWIDGVGTGLCFICVRNISGGSLSEAIILNFAVLKGVTS